MTFALTPLLFIGCVYPADDVDPNGQVELYWDSTERNPTRSTHSLLTRAAIDSLKSDFPELGEYANAILLGANREIHELPLADPELEGLRVAIDGTNWAAGRPLVLWHVASLHYAMGAKGKAYEYAGILLHYVEDMGVPAHAYRVVHQGTLGALDHFESLAVQRWLPEFTPSAWTYHALSTPADYVEWSGELTRRHFEQVFPGVTYTLRLFEPIWFRATALQKQFVRQRQGAVMALTQEALYAVVTNWTR